MKNPPTQPGFLSASDNKRPTFFKRGRARHPRLALPASAALFLLAAGLSPAEVRLPAIFSDHMVLEKTALAPIWGWADPGEDVTVTLGGQSVATKAGEDGRWETALNLQESGPGPFEMKVSGKNALSVRDVVVGEVWLASGQSNMAMTLSNSLGAPEEIASSANPLLRVFKVARTAQEKPAEDVQGTWTVAGPESSGVFTAVGYYFGKALQKELNVPVGLISSSVGGSPSEAWTSPAALAKVPEINEGARRLLESWTESADKLKSFTAWQQSTGRTDRPPTNPASFSEDSPEGWQSVDLPGTITFPGFSGNGAAWVRRDVTLTMSDLTAPLRIDLETLEGFETIYWNGKQIAQTTLTNLTSTKPLRRITVPATALKEGKNTLAVRIFAPAAPAAFTAQPVNFKAGRHSLQGPWLARAEFELPSLSAEEFATVPGLPPQAPPTHHLPSLLYQGMIHPIVPYAISGVIWYQGESNVSRAAQYRTAFPLLIQDWRDLWKNQEMPFYFCQLASFQPKPSTPVESPCAELRSAQSQALSLPNTGQAILIDLGEAADGHPRNKKDVGERLAAIALAKDYGKSLSFSGPVYDSMTIENNAVRVKFTHTDGGLKALPLPETHIVHSHVGKTAPIIRNTPDSEIEGFAICGKDRQWVWAHAKIDGDSVVVSSSGVPDPVAVRYAWSNNPICNLYNDAGLPASPFRTDDFPLTTENARYGIH